MKKNVLIINRGSFRKHYNSKGNFVVDQTRYNVFIITDKKKAHEIPNSEYFELYVCNLDDELNLLKLAEQVNERFKIDYVITYSEPDLLCAAKIRERCNVKGLTYEQTLVFRDKCRMKELLQKSSIRVPRYKELRSYEEALEFLKELSKVVVKPKMGMGAIDTFIIDSEKELLEVYSKIKNDIISYEIEEFIDGVMYHIDSIVQNGEIKLCSISQYNELCIDFSKNKCISSVMEDDFQIQKRIEEFNHKVISALKLLNGVTHLEVFMTSSNNEIIFCEIAARMGGGGVIYAIQEVYGIGLNEATAMIELNEEIPIIKKNDLYSGWILFYPHDGIVDKVPNKEIFIKEWIPEANIFPKKGWQLKNPNSSTDIIARFIVTGNSKREVIDRFNWIKKEFEIIYI